MFGRESGEERQYDFTGSGTILMQSSELLRVDSALMRIVESQTNLLDANSAGQLGRKLMARSQQQ